MKRYFVETIFLVLPIFMSLQAQTLQVALSPDKSKVDRSTKNGMATIFFDSSIENLRIVSTDENPNEQIMKDENDENRWYIKINVKKDIEVDGVCYRNFLLKSPSSGEYYLTTDAIQPNQVLYYTIFLPEIAGGVPLKVNLSFDSAFDRSNFEGVLGFHSSLPQHRLGHGSNTLRAYSNLRDNQYDQLYTITPKGIINNINMGDVMTFIPEDESYKSFTITITDSILKSGEILCSLSKKRSSIHGYVIDAYTHKPVQNCMVQIYLGNCEDRYTDIFGRHDPHRYDNEDFGYKRFFESGEDYGECLTNNNGYFGWRNCVIDYTYYITARSPRGYASIAFNKGVNIKPKDNIKDSLIIEIRPLVYEGVVTNEKSAIPNVEIECETLYGKKIITTSQDGSFEIIGLTSEFIRFKHDSYRIMDIKIDPFHYEKSLLFIIMKKGNKKKPFKGEYKCGNIKEIK